MTSPLPTATWPSISGLEPTSYPSPIKPAPIAIACLFLATIFCLGFIIQPSKLKPIFRRDEEDCLDSGINGETDSSTKVSGSANPHPQGTQAHQGLAPTMLFSVDRSFSASSKGPKSSQGLWTQGQAKENSHMPAISVPAVRRKPHASTTADPEIFVSDSTPLPSKSTAGDNPSHLHPATARGNRYPSAAASTVSGTTAFGGTEVSRWRGLDIGSKYEGSFVPSILSDKRISQDPY